MNSFVEKQTRSFRTLHFEMIGILFADIQNSTDKNSSTYSPIRIVRPKQYYPKSDLELPRPGTKENKLVYYYEF